MHEAIDRLIKPDERGTSMTVDFLKLHASGAPPARMQRSAEEVCVQMAVELRAIVSPGAGRGGRQAGARPTATPTSRRAGVPARWPAGPGTRAQSSPAAHAVGG